MVPRCSTSSPAAIRSRPARRPDSPPSTDWSLSAGPGLCALNIDLYVAAADPVERDAVRTYLERTQRPQGIAALREKWRGELPTSRRRTYILTTADTLVPPETQRVMAASVGADVVEIGADHGLFREQPARLAELLVAAAS